MSGREKPIVAVLGLGEAGSEISRDLVAAGLAVRGYDPLREPPAGVVATGSDADACEGSDLVLSLTTAHESESALGQALPGVGESTIYADLNTGSAGLKQRLAAVARAARIGFVDVAMMSPVPGRGLRTPMLVSGEAADDFVRMFNSVGGNAELLAGPAGAAASRKLIRSVFYKGLAAAVTESLRAAEVAGCEEWIRANIAAELVAADASTLDRLEKGSVVHAVRRTDEMAAAAQLLTELGVPPRIATASRDWLAELSES